MNLLLIITDKNITNYLTTEFNPLQENWFQIKVTDFWGLSSTGNEMTHDIDEPPSVVNIISIEYDISPLQMTISWDPSQDLDFSFYKLQYSDTEIGERTDIVTLSEINTNSFEILEFDPSVERWYWMVTTDHWGQSTVSEGLMIYDEPPSHGVLYPIIYDDGTFYIGWEQNQDDDFAIYRLIESGIHNNNIPTEIYSTVDRDDTTYTVSGMNTDDPISYQLIYEDIWGSQTLTDEQDAISYTRFYKTFGGPNKDVGYSVQQTSDSGYVVVGYTNSYGSGSYDVLLLKTDADGNEDWMKTFGGVHDDRGYSIQKTFDGGFILGGSTDSYGEGSDIWLIKTNSEGDEEWNEVYGGTGTEKGYSVQQTDDGGFIITGYTNSSGSGGFDIFLVKTSSAGVEEWSKTFGDTEIDKGYSVKQTEDSGFIISGITTAEYGFDIRVVKTDADGNEEWNRVFGNTMNDFGFSVVEQTFDNSFVIVGYTEIFGSDDEDLLLTTINDAGNQTGERTFGGYGIDRGYSIINTIDGGFMIIGFTESFSDGNKDVWLIKTDSNGNEEWNKNIGTDKIDHGYYVQQTNDGGFILTGYTDSEENNDDILLIKTDHLGNTQFDY